MRDDTADEMVSQAVATYINMRDEADRIMREAKARVAELEDLMQQLLDEFISPALTPSMARLSMNTGTAYRKTKHAYKVIDGEAMRDWLCERIIAGDREPLGLFTAAVSKSFLDDFIETHNDLPPGIDRREWVEVEVTRPSPKRSKS